MNIEKLLDDFHSFAGNKPLDEAIDLAIWEQEAPTNKSRLFLRGYDVGFLESEKARRFSLKEIIPPKTEITIVYQGSETVPHWTAKSGNFVSRGNSMEDAIANLHLSKGASNAPIPSDP